MNLGERFLDTLRRFNFPEVDKYMVSDFDSITSDKELTMFLESFCNFNEENVLSTQELSEFSAIPASELTKLENFALNEEISLNISQEEQEEEMNFLKDQLKIIMEHNSYLLTKKEVLKAHADFLLEDSSHKVLTCAQKSYEGIALQKIPQMQNELVSVLQSVVEVVLHLKNQIIESYATPEELPSCITRNMESYFNEEKEILNYIQDYFNSNFHHMSCDSGLNCVQTCNISNKDILIVPGYSYSDLEKEILFIKKALKNSMEFEHEIISKNLKVKSKLKFYQNLDDGLFLLDLSSSQLWEKLDKESKKNEILSKKENTLKMQLSHTISALVHEQCKKLGILHAEESSLYYKYNLEKLKQPMECLLNQRSRLEFFHLYLRVFMDKLCSIKDLIDSASVFIENEKKKLAGQKVTNEEKLNAVKVESKYLPENSVFLSVGRMLTGVPPSVHLAFVTVNEVMRSIESLYKEKYAMEKKNKEYQAAMPVLEKQWNLLRTYVCSTSEFSKFSLAERNFELKLNKLDLKLNELRKKFDLECLHNFSEKKQLLERKRNLRLARQLFVHALLDENYFHNCIAEINAAPAHSEETESNS